MILSNEEKQARLQEIKNKVFDLRFEEYEIECHTQDIHKPKKWFEKKV